MLFGSTFCASVAASPCLCPLADRGGVEVPHDTWSGNEATLEAVAKAAAVPMDYTRDFGDTTVEPGAITDESEHFTIEAISFRRRGRFISLCW